MTLQSQGPARWTVPGRAEWNLLVAQHLYQNQAAFDSNSKDGTLQPYALLSIGPLVLEASMGCSGRGRRESQQQQTGLQGSGAGAGKQSPEKRPLVSA